MVKTGLALLAFVYVLFSVSCGEGTGKAVSAKPDSLHLRYVDSLIWVAKKTKNADTAFAVVDSLAKVGDIGPIRTCYERGNICYKILKDNRKGESFWKEAVATPVRGRSEEQYYYACVTHLSNNLQINHDYEGALRISIEAMERMKKSDVCTSMQIGIHLSDIGICQLKMRRFDEAAKSFDSSYNYFRKAVDGDTTTLSMTNAILCTSNIVLFYLDAHRYEDSYRWMMCMDSLIEDYSHSVMVDSAFYDKAYAKSCNFMARTLQGLGKKDEAAQYFKDYQTTESYKKGIVHAPGEFLMESGRYAEAAESYADVENEIHRRVDKPSLDIIQQYVFPKYRANAYAGNRDSAIAVGLRILDALDSAIVWQKEDDAAELATIYETQEKDRQIAEQKASLTHQKMVAGYIVSGVVVFSLLLFIFFRHRAAVRLEVEHKKLLDAYDRLEIANARAEESSRMKSNFIQQISHEIRTPLNVLSGFTQILTTEDMQLDKEMRQDVNQKITENTNRITGLVNKMLELSDINSRTVMERNDEVSVVQVAADAVMASDITSATHLLFDMQILPEVEDVMLQTNQDAATRALSLILDNARKFTAPSENGVGETSQGKQHVILSVQPGAEMVQFVVEDTGIGVPKEEAEHIFEEFVQLNNNYAGTGIGLSVARSLARRMGGDIVLDTSYDGGARFIMTLPVAGL